MLTLQRSTVQSDYIPFLLIVGFSGETWGAETTWKTQVYMGG
jgi:hypothetical protein